MIGKLNLLHVLLQEFCLSHSQNGEPLTFKVTDADGNPVDLSIGLGGGEVNDIMIWNGLFDDVVPLPLPEAYYWVRTDLHNDNWVIDPDTGLPHYLNGYAANDMYVYDNYDWNGDGVAEVDAVGNTLEPIKPDFSERKVVSINSVDLLLMIRVSLK